MDKILHEIGDALLAFLLGLMPSALGAVVGLFYETGITWSRRFAQLSVGVIVSYFVTNAANALWPVDPFVRQAIGFVVGMIAFKATPRFIASCTDMIAEAPSKIFERVLALFPRKDAQ